MGLSSSRTDTEDLIQDCFEDPKRRKLLRKFCSEDILKYQKGYPNQQDHPELRDNYSFYTNQIPCRPEGMFVDELLASLTANPRDWDTSHGFITWLFPTREIGFNLEAQPLQLHEAQDISQNTEARLRVLQAYSLFLAHFGLELIDNSSGEVRKCSDWESCCQHLINRGKEGHHSFLQVSRVMKSLGELGYENLKPGLVRFFIVQFLGKLEEERPNRAAIQALHDYWIPLLRDEQERHACWEEFKCLYSRQKAKSLPMKRERAEGDGEGSKLFHRLGSIRSSLRLDSASSSSSRRMGAEMLDAERALTSHLVMQETLRVQAREGKGDPDLIP